MTVGPTARDGEIEALVVDRYLESLLSREADPISIRPGHPAGVVVGAIVDDDHLERPVGLGEHAVDRLAQVERGVVGGHEDTDQVGRRHHVFFAALRARSSFALIRLAGSGLRPLPAARFSPWYRRFTTTWGCTAN